MTPLHEVLSRLFDDQPQGLAVIARYDGTVEYANRGVYSSPDNVLQLRADKQVGASVVQTMQALGFSKDHPVLQTLQDGKLHIAPSTATLGAWAVASVLPMEVPPELALLLSSVYSVGTREEALQHHQRDVSRALVAIELQTVRQQLARIGESVLIAQRSSEVMEQHVDVIRWAIERENETRSCCR